MTNIDYMAMLELASEMNWPDAIKFIRSESGHGLTEGRQILDNEIRRAHPNSEAIRSFDQYHNRGR